MGSFPINDCSIDEKLGRKFPLVAVTVSVVAGVITLLAIFTICFIVARKKRSEGIFMGSGLNTSKIEYDFFYS